MLAAPGRLDHRWSPPQSLVNTFHPVVSQGLKDNEEPPSAELRTIIRLSIERFLVCK